MSAQVVFLTLFLGLIAGRQPVELQVGQAVKTLRIFVDGKPAATLTAPPWRATIDLGADLQPRELLAIAYDGDGEEAGRATQVINLPRPLAEISLSMQSDDKNAPVAISLRWEHALAAKPSRASITLDGQTLAADAHFQARLPRVNMNHPHVIAAEMRFEDGFVARREMVFGGTVTDSISSELTPVVLTSELAQLTNRKNTSSLAGCFSANGIQVQARGPEISDALVLVVREPNVAEVLNALNPGLSAGLKWNESLQSHHLMSLDRGSSMRYVWPIAQRYSAAGHVPSSMFVTSRDVSSQEAGMIWFLTRSYDAVMIDANEPRRFADAVAVAGINAITGAHRRAVVLVLSRSPDASTAQPAAVRHYLSAVGVPLFVWSLTGPRPDLASSWGTVDDISSTTRFHTALQRLRDSLASQRVAWIAGDPLTALRIKADPRCGLTPLAHLGN
ncbi:MAG: hypothetical protein QOK37_975 [Thermoanaerobaculia bacterium]|nr:hypothetical protein [Thermoanaerobaculia bacterium]